MTLGRWALVAVAVAGCGRIGYDGVVGDGGADGPTDVASDLAPACRFRSIGLGRQHGCAVDSLGRVSCWGRNSAGAATGTPGGGAQTTPSAIALPAPAVEVAAGNEASCARLADHRVFCWGHSAGGNGPPYLAPGEVALGGDARALAMGSGFACAIAGPDDHVACWGSAHFWALGRPNTDDSVDPVTVDNSAGAVRVAAGHHHVCSITAGGVTRCWGKNGHGELGLGFGEDQTAPTVNGALAGLDQLALGGAFSCGVAAGALRCWGDNGRGQLTTAGPGRNQPGATLATGVSAVAAQAKSVCIIDDGGQVACWGQNRAGELGLGDLGRRVAPTPVTGLTSAVALAGGYHHACAEQDGQLWCWGLNDSGQLGRGTKAIATVPRVTGGEAGVDFTRVAMYDQTACAVDTAGALWCWGDNEDGQAGLSHDGAATPRMIVAAGVVNVALGAYYGCARDAAGVLCWGQDYFGQLGNGLPTNESLLPTRAIADPQVTAVATGFGHSCAIVAGALRCWGVNGYGQLGDGTTDQRPAPITVTLGGGAVLAVAAAQDHTCAVSADGVVRCWGDASRGVLGVAIAGGQGMVHPQGGTFVDVATGFFHTCALDGQGVPWCWGDNGADQLGPDGAQPVPVRVPLPGAPAVRAVSLHARYQSTCAILDDGSSSCWGAADHGTGAGGPTPTPFDGANQVIDLGGSAYDLCAVRAGGELACAGLAPRGQLGPSFVGYTPTAVALACE